MPDETLGTESNRLTFVAARVVGDGMQPEQAVAYALEPCFVPITPPTVTLQELSIAGLVGLRGASGPSALIRRCQRPSARHKR